MTQYALNTRPEVPPSVLWCNAHDDLIGKVVVATHQAKGKKVLCTVLLAEKSVPANGQLLCSGETAQKVLRQQELAYAGHPGVTIDVYIAPRVETWWYSDARWGIFASGMGLLTVILAAVGAVLPSWWAAVTGISAAATAGLAFTHTWKSRKP